MPQHNRMKATNMHVAHAYTYADSTVRLAAVGFLSRDVGKLARQVDTGNFYLLANHSPIVWLQVTQQPDDLSPALLIANNLSDLANAATARANLGLDTAATHPATDFLLVASNLSDLASAPTARTNLGLGTISVQDATTVAITGGTITGIGAPSGGTDVTNKSYVDGAINAAVTGLWQDQGGIDCSANPNYPAALKGDAYAVTVAGKIGGASGIDVEVGDLIVCNTDNAGGTQAGVGTSWNQYEHNLVGAVLSSNNLSDLANSATARTNLGIGNVENTALSTWAGSTNIVTVGTLTTGATGAGFTIALSTSTVTGVLGKAQGGTNEDNSTGGVANTFWARPNGATGAATYRAIVAADIPTLNQNTTGSAATLTTARSIYGNNFNGSADLAQIIASTFGGTSNGFTKFTGATTAEKTYTLPDATCTILTTNSLVTVAQGGTGLNTATAYAVICGGTTGTGAFQSIASVGSAGQVLTSNGAGALPTFQAAAGGGSTNNLLPTARLATTAALPACTYANGSSGVGATLTGNSNGALSVDSVAVAVNDLVLVKNQSSGLQNGLFTVTATGSAGAVFVLTRHTSMDTTGEFVRQSVPVGTEGTINIARTYLCSNTSAPTVGTTAITFVRLISAQSGTSITHPVGAIALSPTAVATGAQSVASGQSTASNTYAVAFGRSCTASAVYSAAFNFTTTASGNYSTAFGQNTTASTYGSFAVGKYAKADKKYGFTLAGGRIAALGDCQTSIVVARGTTTGATSVDLLVDNAHRVVIPSNSTWQMLFMITFRDSGGTYAGGMVRTGTLTNNAGTTALIGVINTIGVDNLTAGAVGFTVAITADNTNDCIKITCTSNVAVFTVNWDCAVYIAEITH